jgi:hypothetical protein
MMYLVTLWAQASVGLYGNDNAVLVHIKPIPPSPVGRDSSVGRATRYGLDGTEILTRWRRDFPHPSTSALGPTQPSTKWVAGRFPGCKVAATLRWQPTPL